MIRRSALAIVLLLSACARFGGGEGSDLAGRTFLATEVTGHTLVPGTQLQLSFPERGKLAANAGCNQMSGAVSFDGDRLKVTEMGSTAMGCDEARHDQDAWLAEFLGTGPKFALNGEQLVLTGERETITFVDRKVAQPDQPLQGPRWVVESLLDGQTASSVPAGTQAFLHFSEDTVTGDAGCNEVSGTAVQRPNTIVFANLVTTDRACPGDRGALEAAVLATISGEVTMKIDSDRLELRNANGKGLQLRAT